MRVALVRLGDERRPRSSIDAMKILHDALYGYFGALVRSPAMDAGALVRLDETLPYEASLNALVRERLAPDFGYGDPSRSGAAAS